LARLGGDEFAIIQSAPRETGLTPRERAVVLANRILDALTAPFDLDGHSVVIGTSIGIALAPDDGSDPDDLIKRADLALYATKSKGRNGYNFFDRQMTVVADERQQLEADFRQGLIRGEFELNYQPIVDVATGGVCCVETLVRWRHPTHGLLMPNHFIPIAEDTGLVVPLGEWVLHQACADAMRWPDHVKVAVNLSAVQFRNGNLLDAILSALVDSGLPASRLELEVTESVLLEKEADYIMVLHQAKNIGASVALDDFGTGYSSLTYLKMFPFDKIKIDRSFIKDIAERPDCAAIVSSVVGLGRSLDIVTTAEGVETDLQFEIVRAAGVTQAQGYLFGAAVPQSDLDFGTTAPIRAESGKHAA
jgi:predicted signal transduction protein with EAL and GGDEF domain